MGAYITPSEGPPAAQIKAYMEAESQRLHFQEFLVLEEKEAKALSGDSSNQKLSGQVTFKKMAAHPRTLAAIVRKVPEAEGSSFALGGGDHMFTSPGPDLRGSPPCTCSPLLSVVSYARTTAPASCF